MAPPPVFREFAPLNPLTIYFFFIIFHAVYSRLIPYDPAPQLAEMYFAERPRRITDRFNQLLISFISTT